MEGNAGIAVVETGSGAAVSGAACDGAAGDEVAARGAESEEMVDGNEIKKRKYKHMMNRPSRRVAASGVDKNSGCSEGNLIDGEAAVDSTAKQHREMASGAASSEAVEADASGAGGGMPRASNGGTAGSSKAAGGSSESAGWERAGGEANGAAVSNDDRGAAGSAEDRAAGRQRSDQWEQRRHTGKDAAKKNNGSQPGSDQRGGRDDIAAVADPGAPDGAAASECDRADDVEMKGGANSEAGATVTPVRASREATDTSALPGSSGGSGQHPHQRAKFSYSRRKRQKKREREADGQARD